MSASLDHLPSNKEEELRRVEDDFHYKFELLKQEIDNLQNSIRNSTGNVFTIRSWAISAFSAFIFFAADKQKPIFLVFGAISILLFWFLDSIYRSIHRVFLHRYNQIEKFLRSPEFTQSVVNRSFKDFPIPGTSLSFKMSLREQFKSIFKEAYLIHNSTLYIAMLALIGALAIVLN